MNPLTFWPVTRMRPRIHTVVHRLCTIWIGICPRCRARRRGKLRAGPDANNNHGCSSRRHPQPRRVPRRVGVRGRPAKPVTRRFSQGGFSRVAEDAPGQAGVASAGAEGLMWRRAGLTLSRGTAYRWPVGHGVDHNCVSASVSPVSWPVRYRGAGQCCPTDDVRSPWRSQS